MGAMKKYTALVLGLAAMAAIPAMIWAQGAGYPITVVPPGKGPYTFPQGYQTPWDKIDIFVTEKMSPNLFVLHGSEGLDSGAPRCVGRKGHGALRAGRRAHGGHRKPAGGRENAEGDPDRSPTRPSRCS